MQRPNLTALFNPRGLRTALTCLALIFAASAPGLGRLGAQDAAAAIRQAKGFLEEDKFLDGLGAAQEAVRAAPQNYLGHYYVAYAQLGLSQYESAAAAANRALGLAPADSKEGVAKLVEAIKLRSQAGGITKAAEEALSEGLNAKAARLYEQAWNAGRDNPELGLKAAEIYMGALKQPLDAGRVLQQVRRVATGTFSRTRGIHSHEMKVRFLVSCLDLKNYTEFGPDAPHPVWVTCKISSSMGRPILGQSSFSPTS